MRESRNWRMDGCLMERSGAFPARLTTEVSNYFGFAKSPHGNKSMIQLLNRLRLIIIYISALDMDYVN